MYSDESDLEKKIKDLKLNEKSDINILLLGETGVGKSTFINSIANYLTYPGIKTAEKDNLVFLIPSKYEIADKHGLYHKIQIGPEEDQNEYLEVGVSATQDVKTYVFPIWGEKTKIRLIDTPGMGDTRGIEQDDINSENILRYIGKLHELHAICFLFKPTNARITVFFKYCMAQILSRLDKSASKNIIFVFTNTRGTNYSPGETLSTLREVVKDIKANPPFVEIPLNRNIFCFDNEAFKYLAAKKKGVQFDTSVKLRNKESWQKSASECWGLIRYIVGDAMNSPLRPHFMKSTSAINEARRLITQLSQPLADIAQLINDNLLRLQRHQQNLNLDRNSLEELKKKLYMPIINLEITKLTQPVTVCANSKCAEVYKVGDTNKWHYKQRCHDPCHLKNITEEIIGDPGLIHCAAMNSSKTCKECGCYFSAHMHIYFMTKTKEDCILDPNIQTNINSKEKILDKAKQLIQDILKRKIELEKEHDIIVKCCARFAHFLQNNAITPFNDSYKEYINYLIIREKSLGVLCDMVSVHYLEKLLGEYEEAKNTFDEALKIQKKLGESDYITPQKIQESINELYKLKHNGKIIKELYECQKKSRSKEHEFTEYVHKITTTKRESKTEKSENKETKGNEKKKPDFKNKPFYKGGNEYKQGNARSQQMGKSNTSSPSYQNESHPFPRFYNPPPVAGPSYLPPHIYEGYSLQAHAPSPYPPHGPGPYSHHSPAPYPPHNSAPYPQAPGPARYFATPSYSDRDSNDQKKNRSTYEFKVVLDKHNKNRPSASREHPLQESYHGWEPYPAEYPPREPYPSYEAGYYRHPYHQGVHEIPPSRGHSHQYDPGHSSGRQLVRRPIQRARGGYRGRGGRGAVQYHQTKFKHASSHKKNKDLNKDSDSNENSDSSDSDTASRKK